MELMASFGAILKSFSGLLSLKGDIENFVSTVQFLHQAMAKGWRRLVQNPKGCSDNVPSSYSGSDDTCFGDHELEGVTDLEVNIIMNKIGMKCGMHEETRFGLEEFGSLFDELEPSLQEIREAFGVFDVNKDGYIDAVELQKVLCGLGMTDRCGLNECARMIRAFDCNGDGLVDFGDFVKLMERCLC